MSDPAFYSLVTLYVLMIGGSVLGNLLVIVAVLKSPNMRKVRISTLETHTKTLGMNEDFNVVMLSRRPIANVV